MSESAPVGTEEGSPGFDVDPTAVLPHLGLAVLYATTILGGLALADEASAMGLVAFENPGHVGNVGTFAVYVLGFTAVFVAAVRLGKGLQLIRLVFVVLASGLAGTAFVLATGIGTVAPGNALVGGFPTSPVPIALSILTAGLLWFYPEWYVNDAAAVVFGAVAIPMFGLSFGPLPIVVLLVVWAAYDAVSVYGSGHMKDVANGALSMKLPIVFVVPTSRGFSLREVDVSAAFDDSDAGSDDADSGGVDEDEDGAFPAMLLGLGDALIPGMLAVSAGHFLDAPAIVPALNVNAPAIGALLGGLVGLGALMYLVHRTESAHAGLPPLNAGVLAGYLLGAVAAGVPVTTAIGF